MNVRSMVWRFAAAFWALFGIVSGIQVWISMITHGHSVPRLLGYYIRRRRCTRRGAPA